MDQICRETDMKTFAAAALLLLSALCVESLPSWQQLEVRLRTTGKVFESYQELQAVKGFQEFLSKTNASVLMEMAAQNQYPLVAVAGFLCISANLSRTEGFEAALRVLVFADNPGSPIYLPAFQFLTNAIPQRDFNILFQESVRSVPRNSKIMSTIVSQVRAELLSGWFHNQDRLPALPSWEAVVLDRLHRQYRETGLMISRKMKVATVELREIPGTPQLVYLLYSDGEDSAYIQTLNEALSDDGLARDQLAILFSNRRQFIREHVDLGKLYLSEDRRKLMQRLFDR
jgi:hypothetical protein